jgi:hypothetical protein
MGPATIVGGREAVRPRSELAGPTQDPGLAFYALFTIVPLLALIIGLVVSVAPPGTRRS